MAETAAEYEARQANQFALALDLGLVPGSDAYAAALDHIQQLMNPRVIINDEGLTEETEGLSEEDATRLVKQAFGIAKRQIRREDGTVGEEEYEEGHPDGG